MTLCRIRNRPSSDSRTFFRMIGNIATHGPCFLATIPVTLVLWILESKNIFNYSHFYKRMTQNFNNLLKIMTHSLKTMPKIFSILLGRSLKERPPRFLDRRRVILIDLYGLAEFYWLLILEPKGKEVGLYSFIPVIQFCQHMFSWSIENCDINL